MTCLWVGFNGISTLERYFVLKNESFVFKFLNEQSSFVYIHVR